MPFLTEDPRILAFARYWFALPRDSGVPLFDPAHAMRHIGPLFPSMVLAEVRSPMELYVRVAGSAVRELYRREITGRNLLDLTADDLKALRFKRFEFGVSLPCGQHVRHRIPKVTKVWAQFETLALPVRTPSSNSVRLLAVLALTEPAPAGDAVDTGWPVADAFAYVDIGFGIPSPADDPTAFWPAVTNPQPR